MAKIRSLYQTVSGHRDLLLRPLLLTNVSISIDQCDQIRRFFKFLGDEFSLISPKYLVTFWAKVKNNIL